MKQNERKVSRMAKALCLGIAYSANIGGIATLTGTMTNVILSDYVHRYMISRNVKPKLNYASWFFFGFPLSVICQFFCWVWLQYHYFGWRSFIHRKGTTGNQEILISKLVNEEYIALGKMKFGEKSMLFLFALLILLWLFRDPGFIPGYASLFKPRYITDSVPAICISFILFFFPSECPQWICLRKNKDVAAKRVKPLLDWKTVSTKMAWGPVFMLGGGYVLAKGCETSGLSLLFGNQFLSLSDQKDWVICLVVVIAVAVSTEFMSNNAVVFLFAPIISSLSDSLKINMLYLMLPAGIAASLAFMLPIATPPNAIVFAYGHLKTFDMVKVGFAVKIMCIFFLVLFTNSLGVYLFDLRNLPLPPINTTVP